MGAHHVADTPDRVNEGKGMPAIDLPPEIADVDADVLRLLFDVPPRLLELFSLLDGQVQLALEPLDAPDNAREGPRSGSGGLSPAAMGLINRQAPPRAAVTSRINRFFSIGLLLSYPSHCPHSRQRSRIEYRSDLRAVCESAVSLLRKGHVPCSGAPGSGDWLAVTWRHVS
jgi:hypothetical protein